MVSGAVPGPRSRRLLAAQEELESSAVSYPREVPVAFSEGRGATIRDVDGNTFVDFFAGAGVLNLGHGHPVVARAAQEQQQRLVHALDFPTEPRVDLMRALKEILPGSLSERARFHFGGPTGSDAIEAALKLTRAHTGRSGVVSFSGAYHGMTAGALSVSGQANGSVIGGEGVHFTPYAYCYRCPLKLRPESCDLACAELLESALADPQSGVPRPAAVLVEPVQGEGGTVVPPPGWLTRISDICRSHGLPLIVDEVQTGFGRTGTMFACEHDGLSPDVVVLSKAIGGIGFPLAGIAFDVRLDGWGPGSHIGTFRGHQVAMAAGIAAISQTVDLGLPARAQALGEVAMGMLSTGAEDLAAVGETRGRGLMIGVELVRSASTREPWPELASEVRRGCLENGVLVEVGGRHANVVRFLPPLVISQLLLERGIEIFLETLGELEAAGGRPS